MMSVKGLAPLYRDSHELPWIPFTPYSTSVKLKLLKIDPVTGQVITLLHVPGGEGLGVHNHHGMVIVYTVQGAWRYLEHEWTAKAGDFVYETAGSQHTLIAEPGEDLVAFIVIEGALEFVLSFQLRPLQGSGWLLVDGIVTLVLAAMIGSAWPISSVWAVGTLVGVSMFSSGITRLMLSAAVRQTVA